jgi:hypothetical protein
MSQRYTEGYYDSYGLDAFNGVEPFVVTDSYREYPEDEGIDRGVYDNSRSMLSHGYVVRSSGYMVYSQSKNGEFYFADQHLGHMCLGRFIDAMNDEDRDLFLKNFDLDEDGQLLNS